MSPGISTTFGFLVSLQKYKVQMLTKDKVRKTIDRLPENFTVDQIVEELVILEKIEEGLKDIEEGRVFSADQVKQELKTWLK
jgi:predicted transcriptional regulator